MKQTSVKPSARGPGRAQFSNAARGAGRITIAAPAIFIPQFVNAHDLIGGADPGGGYKHGQVFFANDSRFLESYFSEPLTNYAVGFKDPNDIAAMCEFVAPLVRVGRRFEWKAAVNAEEFLSEVVDDQRAIGADFKRVAYTGTDVTDKTLNRGLTYIADLDNVNGANWQNEKVGKLLRRLNRNRLRRGITALSASAVSVGANWPAVPDAPGSVPPNPDQDVRDQLKAATDISGIRPNRVLYGDSAFNTRQACYGARNNPAGYVGYGANAMQSVAAALMVDQVMVSKERYQSGAAAKSEIIGSNVLAYYAESGVDTEDPSNIKCFVSEFDAEQGGGLERVFVQQISSKLVAITVERYEKMVVTYTGGIRIMPVTAN